MGSDGWRSRGYLPHFDSPNEIQLITFHLADSLPKHALVQIASKLEELPASKRKAEKQRRLQKWLDAGYGECHLRQPEIARVVEEFLFARDEVDYRLLEWVVMPNHIHVLAELAAHAPMAEVVKRWKGGSSHRINRILGRRGTFWFREYHDRFMRDGDHFSNSVAYVRENPVKAGLCKAAEDWEFGSAARRTPTSSG